MRLLDVPYQRGTARKGTRALVALMRPLADMHQSVAHVVGKVSKVVFGAKVASVKFGAIWRRSASTSPSNLGRTRLQVLIK